MQVKRQIDEARIARGTDDCLAMESSEFVWTGAEHSWVHAFLVPETIRILRRYGATSVLDLGCGNGAVTGAVAAEGFQIVGCDVSSSGLSQARLRHKHLTFFEHEFSQPLSADHKGAYDAVIALEVIEHLLLPRTLLANALQALRPGGLFVLSTPYHGYWKNLALALTNKFDQHWHPLRDFGHVKFFSKRTLLQLLREAGFEIQAVLRLGRVPFLACSMLVAATAPGSKSPADGQRNDSSRE